MTPGEELELYRERWKAALKKCVRQAEEIIFHRRMNEKLAAERDHWRNRYNKEVSKRVRNRGMPEEALRDLEEWPISRKRKDAVWALARKAAK